MINKLYGTNGGWSSLREINYDGICQVYGTDYHQITPIVSGGEWQDMIKWVLETFGACSHERGPGVWTPDQPWYANNGKFLFKDIEDCEWFLLRWQ